MKTFLSNRLVQLCCMLVWISPGFPIYGQEKLTEGDRQLVSWFEQLGYPDLQSKPPVAVLTGWWSQSGDLPPMNSTLVGFLLSRDEAKFKVFGIDLTTYEFEFTPAGTPPHKMVTFKETDFKTLVEEELQKRNASDEDRPWFYHFGQKTTEPVKLLVLACAATASGFENEARQILKLARSIPDRQNDNLDFEQRIQRDIGHTLTWKAVLEFRDPKIPRKQLLEKFEYLNRHFPDSQHNGRVQDTIAMLKKMVQEDEAHAKSAKPIEELSGDELIAELIFQLRNQNGQQWSQPGSCNIFLDPRGDASPAHRLFELKETAVPLLIEAMDDRRFTRSVGYHRDFYFSHHVLRVGDCAQSILSRIAGRSFYVPNSTNGAMIKEGKSVTAKTLAKNWWSEVQSKGAKAVLIEAVKKGDRDSIHQARQLVEKHPDDAVAAMEEGIQNADSWVLNSLIQILATMDDKRVVPILKKQLTEAKRIGTRVLAAKAIAKSDPDFARVAMQELWASTTDASSRLEEYDDRVTLGSFLLSTNSKASIELVTNRFGFLTTREKYDIIESIGNFDDVPKEVLPVLEKFLVTQLQDNSAVNSAGSYHGQSFSNPRIRDIAGYTMTNLWPKKYNCRLDGTRKQRNQSQQQAINRWRLENDLDPLDFPKPFVATPVAEKITDELSAVIENAKSEETAAVAFEKYKELGTGAYEAAQYLNDSIGSNHPLKRNVHEMVLEIGNTITRSTITNSKPVPQAWRERFKAIQGSPLTPEWLVRQLTDFAKERPTSGIRLFASRESPVNGIELNVEFVSSAKRRSGTQQMWNLNKNISVDGQTILNSQSGSSLEYAQQDDWHSDLKNKLEKIYADASQSFEIDIALVIDQ